MLVFYLLVNLLVKDEEEKDRIIDSFLTLPLQHSSTLFYNHCSQDWRDVIPRINIPTLVVGGRVSLIPWKSQEWIHSQIAGSRLEIFEEEEESREQRQDQKEG